MNYVQIPIDVQWNDIDAMDNYKQFTYNKTTFAGLPQYVDQLHKQGMKYVQIFEISVSPRLLMPRG